MARPLDDGGDPRIAEARARARLAHEQARARRERTKADLLEGKSIPIEDARRQILDLAAAVRGALDHAPAYLPADLQPEVREAAARAMSEAIAHALREIKRRE